MQSDIMRYINALWLLVGIYWAAAALREKPAIKVQSSASRALHLAFVCVAGLLIWSRFTSFGFLARRFVPDAPWIDGLALALSLVGCGFASWARVCIGSNWSAIVTVKQNHELIRRGPYALVRHPIYSGFLLALSATALAVGEIRALIGVGFAFLTFFLKSASEEQFMREEFGGEYTRYSQRVKRLIPFIL